MLNGSPALSRGGPERGRRVMKVGPAEESVMRVLETFIVVLIATVAFLWVILAHSTPEEHARLYDAMGESTHIAWR